MTETISLNQKVLSIYQPIFIKEGNIRYVILMGGRGGGRSTVASQYALANLVDPQYFRCAIMRYIHTDIRNSIYQEIVDRIDEQGVDENIHTVDNKMSFSYGKNTINSIGFKKSSGQQKSKLKSLAGYTNIIIEEADEIEELDFMQLDDSLRTVKGEIMIMLLLNPPVAEHWIIKRWFDLEPATEQSQAGYFIPKLKKQYQHNTLFIEAMYRDNYKHLDEATIFNYENYKNTRLHYYNNTILGLVPQIVYGKIYNGWDMIDGIPPEAKLVKRGLDYGFSNDPSVLVDIYSWNGGYIIDERLYRKGMSNKALSDFINADEEVVLTVADSSEPKSIQEMEDHGVLIIGAIKGPGSVSQGISFVQDQKIFVTRRSQKTWKAYNNYTWATNSSGSITNVPDDTNHEWSNPMDAIRYGLNVLNRGESQDDPGHDESLFDDQSGGNL